MVRNLLRLALSMIALTGLAVGQAKADVYISDGTLVSSGGGMFTYSFDAYLQPQSSLTASPSGASGNTFNGFAIVDIAGFVSATSLVGGPGGFSVVNGFALPAGPQGVGGAQIAYNHLSDHAFFKYTGAGLAGSNTSQVFLGSFTVTTTVATQDLSYIGVSQRKGHMTDAANNISVLHIAAVPEPSTFVLAGLGGLGLVGYAIRRKKSA
jgi:hypothetical protein